MSDELTYPIRLDQFLKLVNIVGSGGEAKNLIVDGMVAVNGDVETRRGRKLQAGDLVQVGDAEPISVGES